jgi:Fe-S cluster assembly protein SufD
MSALAQQWTEAFHSGGSLAGPAWLDEIRMRAIQQLNEHGLPQRKTEAWKYTPMRVLENMNPAIRGHASGMVESVTDSEARQGDLLESPNGIVDILDGRLAGKSCNRPGVSIVPLHEGLELYENRLRGHVEKVDIGGATSAFAALNTAFLENGVVIHIGEQIDAGSLLLRWAFTGRSEGGMHNFRIFVLLEPGARLQLTEQFNDSSASGRAMNVISHLELDDAAVLDHVRVQKEPEDSVLISTSNITLAAESRYSYSGFDLGGGLVRHELQAELAGAGAHAAFMGAFVLDKTRHADNHISVDHAVAGCSSEQFFRGVLGGSSRGVFNGRALIRAGADGSSVRQSNANLLLSGLAEMDTKPELEIYADEVEASHGATVGQLDELAVFYLRTRGLSDSAARRMLTGAFCHAVTDRMEQSSLAARIAELIDEAMPSDSPEEIPPLHAGR